MVLHPALPPKTSDSSDESSDLALLTFCLDCERRDDEKSKRIQTFVCLFVFLLCSTSILLQDLKSQIGMTSHLTEKWWLEDYSTL